MVVIELRVIGEVAIGGHAYLGDTCMIFGPPDRGMGIPGDDPEVNARALVLSGHGDYRDVTSDEAAEIIRVLAEKYPDRDIYLQGVDDLVLAYQGRVG